MKKIISWMYYATKLSNLIYILHSVKPSTYMVEWVSYGGITRLALGCILVRGISNR